MGSFDADTWNEPPNGSAVLQTGNVFYRDDAWAEGDARWLMCGSPSRYTWEWICTASTFEDDELKRPGRPVLLATDAERVKAGWLPPDQAAALRAERDEAQKIIRNAHEAIRHHTTAAQVALAMFHKADCGEPSLLDELTTLRAKVAAFDSPVEGQPTDD